MIEKILLSLVLSYIIGSLSLGYFLGKLKGIDLRKCGPIKNIGASNVRHVLGFKYAIISGIFDAAKGIIAIVVGIFLNVPFFIYPFNGLLAILGHCFPFYLNFKGGRGAATALGLVIFGFALLLISKSFSLLALFIFALFSLTFLFLTRAKNLTAIFSTLLFFILIFPQAKNDWRWIIAIGFLWLSVLGIIAIKEKGIKA
jgi:glycerol-3-phosphate acyltransferase PlsY